MEQTILKIVFLLALVTSTLAILPVQLAGVETKADENYRLPNNTRPYNYYISLTTNVHKNDYKFIGNVVINIAVAAGTRDIVLHSRKIDIIDINLSLARNTSAVYPVTHSYEALREFLTIHTEEPLASTTYRLEINYNGTLRTDNAGFYLSTYTNDNNQKISLATTQFESTDARHAFPCYDEPAIKAVFYISITHGKNYSAISNMPALGDPKDNEDGTVTTTFEPTRLMSTYLLAFIVSDFVNSQLYNRIPHRIYSRPGTIEDQSLALSTSALTLNAIEDYLNVKYSLPKMDNVAVPDFAAGAMENWGLVTYREEYLLYNEQKSTAGTKTNIATIIAHEFGHQYFGNLVSPLWWTYLWLNEGFATLFAILATDHVYPSWDIWQDFIASDLQQALSSDSTKSPRPMSHYVQTPREISLLFNYVSYQKGGSFLRMIQHAFTDATFRKALKHYLEKMEYTSANEEDLFSSLQIAVNEDEIFGNDNILVEDILSTWTRQGGYPLITVKRNYDDGTFTITQEPFDGTNQTSTSDTRSWWVPYNFATANESDFTSTKIDGYLKVNEKSKTISQGNVKWSADDWIMLNKQVTSYYRVNYDDKNWQLISDALMNNPTKLHTHNRAQTLDDAYRLYVAKRIPLNIVFTLARYLKNEDQYAPWATANKILTTFNNYLNADKDYELFQLYVRDLVEDFYKKVGVNEQSSDPHLRKLSRSVAINWACRSKASDCLDMTNAKLNDLVKNGTEVEPNLRNSIFCNGLISAGETEYNFMLNRLLKSDDQAERRQLMTSLGCIQSAEILKKFLETSIDHSANINYREQERLNIVSSVVTQGHAGLTAAIDFLLNNYNDYNKLPTDFTQTNPLVLAISNIASRVVSKEQQDHFNSLLDKIQSVQGVESADVESARNTATNNLKWITDNREELIDWFTAYKESKGDGATTIVVSTSAIAAIIIVSFRTLFF